MINIVKNKISVGNQPYDIAISRNDQTAYITNEITNNVAVVDLINKKLIATIPVGHQPHFIIAENNL